MRLRTHVHILPGGFATSMSTITGIVFLGFILLLISSRSQHTHANRENCQPSLSGFSGILLDIDFRNSSCVCTGPCFQENSNGSCDLATGTFTSNCFILKETEAGRFKCSTPERVERETEREYIFGRVSSILFAASAVAAALPFLILICVMLPYLGLHKKHHGRGKAARSAITIIAASFVVGWLTCGVLIVIGLIIRETAQSNCLQTTND